MVDDDNDNHCGQDDDDNIIFVGTGSDPLARLLPMIAVISVLPASNPKPRFL